MAPTKGSSKKPVKSSTVSMSRMDFRIAELVYQRFNAIGLTDEEVSFLLGKRNKYVFDLLDPTEKDKFKTEQLDILPTILNTTIRALVPNDIKPNETIRVKGEKKFSATKIIYEYVIVYVDNTESEPVTIVKKIIKGGRKKMHPEVQRLTLELIDADHFATAKNALELFLFYKEKLTIAFTPADLQKSLSLCLREDGKTPSLKREINEARYFYKQA